MILKLLASYLLYP